VEGVEPILAVQDANGNFPPPPKKVVESFSFSGPSYSSSPKNVVTMVSKDL